MTRTASCSATDPVDTRMDRPVRLEDVTGGRRVLVLGLGQSGIAALDLLLEHGRCAALGVADERPLRALQPVQRRRWRAFHAAGVTGWFHPDDLRWLRSWDLVVVSPGFPPWHPWLQAIRARGIPIMTEFELGYVAAPPGYWIGITGTNGKTTTTQWIGTVLAHAGLPVVVCGNIGQPVAAAVRRARPGSYYVVELSSFQLYWARYFAPDIGVLLNIDQDHLDWHETPDAYVTAKLRLFARQRPDQWAIVNADETHLWDAYRLIPGRLISFGIRYGGVPGAGLRNDWMVLWWERPWPIGHIRRLPVRWTFMIANALAAVLTGVVAHLPLSVLRTALPHLQPLHHRLQWVDRIRGVDFFDDSKATNVHALRWALQSLPQRVVLIAGGQGKHQDFTPVRHVIAAKTRAVVLIGENAPELHDAWRNTGVPIVRVATMQTAVERAFALARPGDAVLLSPGCASFDMFRDYAHRGQVFQAAVRQLRERLHPLTCSDSPGE